MVPFQHGLSIVESVPTNSVFPTVETKGFTLSPGGIRFSYATTCQKMFMMT
jgi:hypothetical protein